jgi:RNA polymerase sigma-54 factor
MALKQTQQLKLAQKLLPQQILLMKLLQLPTMALEERIKEELEANPALEEDDGSVSEEDLYSNENSEEPDLTGEDEADESGDISDKEMKASDDVEMEDYMDAEELD